MKHLLVFGGLAVLALLLAATIAQAVDTARGPTWADLERERLALEHAQAVAPAQAAAAQALALAPAVFVYLVMGLAAAGGAAALARFLRRLPYAAPDELGRLPVRLDDAQAARAALASFHVTRTEEARRQLVPAHYAPHIAYHNRTDGAGAALAPAHELPAATLPTFAQLLDGGRIGPGQPLYLGGDVATGEGVWGDWRDLYSAGLGGKQGSGKSWTAASLIGQSLLGGARVILCDPHAGDAESLATRLEPLASAMELVADDERGILDATRYAHDEFQRRKELAKAKQPYDPRPVVLVIDEWTSLLRGRLGDELPPLLAALTTEGRKYGVNALLLAQRWEAAAAGGGDVRNTLTAHYVHRMRGDEARMMTGLRASALPDDTLALQPGQAYLFDTRGRVLRVATPTMTAADLGRVAQLLGRGAPAAPTTAAPALIGFRPPTREGVNGGASAGAQAPPLRGHQDAEKLTAEEARIVAAFLGGKSASDLAAELAGGKKSGDAYAQAARRVAEAIRKALAAGRG